MFRNVFHEVIFVITAVAAQFIAPFNLASTILPGFLIVHDLGGSIPQIAWLTSAFSMGIGAFLLIAGQLADILGPKTIYIVGLLCHSFVNVGLGFAKTIHAFTILRGLAGMFLGLAIPAGIAMIAHAYPPGFKRNLGFSAFAVCMMTGWVLGSFSAAIWVEYYKYHWAFWVIAMMAFAVGTSAFFVIPNGLNVKSGSFKDIDYLGIAAGLVSMLIITFAINQGAAEGWTHPYVYSLFAVGMLIAFLFIFIESKVKEPVMPLSTWSNPVVAAVMGCLTMCFTGFGVYLLFITTLMQMRGYDYIQIAVHWIPGAVSAVLATIAIPSLLRAGVHIMFPIATLVIAISFLLIALSPLHQIYWAQMFIAIIIAVPGSIWLPASAQMVVSASVGPESQGIAGSLVNVVTALPVGWGLSCASMIQERILEHHGSAIKGVNGAAWLGFSLAATSFLLSLAVYKKLMEANDRLNAVPVTAGGGGPMDVTVKSS